VRPHEPRDSLQEVQVLAVAARAVAAVLIAVTPDTNFDVHDIVQLLSVGLPSEIVAGESRGSNTRMRLFVTRAICYNYFHYDLLDPLFVHVRPIRTAHDNLETI